METGKSEEREGKKKPWRGAGRLSSQEKLVGIRMEGDVFAVFSSFFLGIKPPPGAGAAGSSNVRIPQAPNVSSMKKINLWEHSRGLGRVKQGVKASLQRLGRWQKLCQHHKPDFIPVKAFYSDKAEQEPGVRKKTPQKTQKTPMNSTPHNSLAFN